MVPFQSRTEGWFSLQLFPTVRWSGPLCDDQVVVAAFIFASPLSAFCYTCEHGRAANFQWQMGSRKTYTRLLIIFFHHSGVSWKNQTILGIRATARTYPCVTSFNNSSFTALCIVFPNEARIWQLFQFKDLFVSWRSFCRYLTFGTSSCGPDTEPIRCFHTSTYKIDEDWSSKVVEKQRLMKSQRLNQKLCLPFFFIFQ